MNSNEEQIDIRSNRRERSGSATSILSISSETTREPRKYSTMDLKTLLKTVENIDISAFDRRRLFNPRKQRSCHKRPEPMSEELRKRESSKNSREYTKRNRDEISTCRVLLNDLNAVSNRLKELLTDFSIPTVEKQFQSAVSDTESIIRKYFIGPNLKKEFGLPELEPLLKEYQDKATETMLFEHRPSSPNQHKVKLEELKEQFEKLTTDKDGLNSSKDKTNFASSKSRLNQRIVRENLKSACWDCWKDINTMTVQGEELQQHHDTLKQQVWEKIMSVYCHVFGRFKQKVQFDVIKIDKIVAFFNPFSLHPGKLQLKWTPNEKKIPEVITINSDDDDIMEATKNPQPSPLPSSSLAVDVNIDRVSPVERPKCMDMTNVLNPLIQDRLITTTQFTPPALSSPSFTLSLPIVPATFIPASNTELKKPKLEPVTPKIIVTSVESTSPQSVVKKEPKVEAASSELLECHSVRKSSTSPSNTDIKVKKPSIDIDTHLKMNSPMLDNAIQFSHFPTHVPFPMMPPITSMPVTTDALTLNHLPYNPLLAAAPGEMTPFEALTPSFLRAIEQQRVMAAF